MLAFLRKCPVGIGHLSNHSEQGIPFSATRRQQHRDRGGRPLRLLHQNQELLLHHFLETSEADALRFGQLGVDLLQHLEAALVEALLWMPHINQRAQRGFNRRGLLNSPFQLRARALDRGLPGKLALDVPSRLRTVGAQSDQRLQQRRAVGGHENPFHHCGHR